MIKAFVRAAVASLALLALSPAAQADENWDVAKKAFEQCITLYPDTRAIKAALKEEGWRYEGNVGRLNLHSRNDYRAIAATQGNSQIGARCVASASGFKPSDAMAYADELSKMLENRTEIKRDPAGVIWEGLHKGNLVRIASSDVFNLEVMRGALVLFGQP